MEIDNRRQYVPTTRRQFEQQAKAMGSKLRLYRIKHGIDIKTLSRETGVPKAAIERIENGDVSATLGSMDAVCEFFGKTILEVWENR